MRKNKGYKRTIAGLYKAMKRQGYYTGNKKKKAPKAGKMEEMCYPGEKIQIDAKYVPKSCITNEYKEKMYQYTAIDEYSRVRYIEGFNENSTDTAKVFLIHDTV